MTIFFINKTEAIDIKGQDGTSPGIFRFQHGTGFLLEFLPVVAAGNLINIGHPFQSLFGPILVKQNDGKQ